MYVAQVIALLAVVYIVVRLINDYRRGRIEWASLLSWLAIVAVFGIVAAFPLQISNEIKNVLGLGRGLDALIVVSIGLMFLLMFELYVEVDRTKREITELTRKIAIELEEINERLEKLEKKL
ncbi:MAG: hypothetical protein PWQ79_1472 [Thermococcaceae archaeon]|nr:hypothetical protein [Thermococcaceae archaeon]